MCTYCYMGDHIFRHDPPWYPDLGMPWWPTVPKPLPAFPKPELPYPTPSKAEPSVPTPPEGYSPWSLQRLKEYLELLQQIKALEDQIGCPCEPNKADYLSMFKERIAGLEAKINDTQKP